MGQVVEFMLLRGVNEDAIILLLMVPIISTIVSIARHLVGIKSFGVFTPVLLSVAYASISESTKTNLVYGLSITIITTLGVLVAQYLLDVNRYKAFRMHYLPKLGVIMSLVSIGLFSILLAAAALDKSFAQVDPLPFLMIIILVESFVSKAFNKGFRSALTVTIETLILSLIGYFTIFLEPLRNTLLKNPEFVLLTFPANFIIGKFTGLRLTEWFRFSDIEENV